jgi:phage terminase large subunit GpA-like protein
MTGPRMLVKDRPPSFRTIGEMISAASQAIRPAERLTITEAARRYVKIREKNYSGPWSPERTPYMVEPQDTLTSLDHTGMAFVGPARTGKSQAFLNWLSYSAICDPESMMLVQMSMARAREFSLSDLAKLFRNSPDVRAKLTPGRANDNVFDKSFLSGMRLTIVHPSINELSGKTSGRNWWMDYDRAPSDIDGEGDGWSLLKKRAQTLGRYGMTVVESSPGFEVTDGKWIASTPHEAPPCEGILSIYNAGDRRRWQWRCPQCGGAFEPDFKLFSYPKSDDIRESAEQVTLVCPHDGFPMTPDMQFELNQGGRWIREGQRWLEDGSIVGTPRRSDIASFWLKGPAAGFSTWPQLVEEYLTAQALFESTGSEEKLKAVVNTSLGLPYTPKALEAGRLPEELKARAKPYARKGEVPEGVAFLVSTIDVQAGGRPSFVCHTYGIGPARLDSGKWAVDVWHVDMKKIRKSRRPDEDGGFKLIDPAAYPEDWDVLIDEVIEKTYPLADGSGRHMAVKIIACDSGGAAAAGNEKKSSLSDGPVVSVTSNAYEFWRRLRDDKEARGHHRRFHLVKGAPSRDGGTPRLHRTLPDSQQKDRYAIARGDVPVWLVNSNMVKDSVGNMLGRTDPGGQVHFPVWYDDAGDRIDIDWLYSQLTTEVRDKRGWSNPSRRKNEAFDLLAYCLAILLHPDIRIEQFDWDNPPGWAQTDWSKNDMVSVAGVERPFTQKPAARRSLADLAGELA